MFRGCPSVPLPLPQVVCKERALLLQEPPSLPCPLAECWGCLPPDRGVPLRPLAARGRRALLSGEYPLVISLVAARVKYALLIGGVFLCFFWMTAYRGGALCLFCYPVPVSILLVTPVPKVSSRSSPIPWVPCGRWVARRPLWLQKAVLAARDRAVLRPGTVRAIGMPLRAHLCDPFCIYLYCALRCAQWYLWLLPDLHPPLRGRLRCSPWCSGRLRVFRPLPALIWFSPALRRPRGSLKIFCPPKTTPPLWGCWCPLATRIPFPFSSDPHWGFPPIRRPQGSPIFLPLQRTLRPSFLARWRPSYFYFLFPMVDPCS